MIQTLNKKNMLTLILSRRQVIPFCTRQIHHAVVSTQIIKPSLPTQPHLKRYNLSLIDQFCPWVYMPIIFHYPNNTAVQDTIVEKSRRLKNSLSDTLTQYYPFAGRLDTSGSYVACKDEGIEFQEVKIECQLSEFIKKPEHEVRDFLYPKRDFTCKYESPLLVVRLNHFQCGGISILVCLSHKLGDATSFITFMKSWATNTRRISNSSNEELITESPHFISHPDEITGSSAHPPEEVPYITRKFVFPNSEIAKLKAKIEGNSYTSAATRVEVLSSFLFQRVIASSSGEFASKALLLPVNMRRKIIPPLPETAIGNFTWMLTAVIRNLNENNINVMVEQIKASKVDIEGKTKWENLNNRLALEEELVPYNTKYIVCSSISRMKIYEIDFGWGNPYRVTLADTMINDVFLLIDTPTGDGIEATVALNEQHMTVFQDDKEFLSYTCSE